MERNRRGLSSGVGENEATPPQQNASIVACTGVLGFDGRVVYVPERTTFSFASAVPALAL